MDKARGAANGTRTEETVCPSTRNGVTTLGNAAMAPIARAGSYVGVARLVFLIGVLATGWLLLPASVTASVNLSVNTTDVPGSDDLVVRSEGVDTNIVFVRYEQPVYVIRSSESPLTAGAGCLIVDLDVAVCVGQIGSATIRGGDGADVIDFAGVPVPVGGSGGPGDDALSGGTAANTL